MTEYGFASAAPLFGKVSHLAVHQERIYLGAADLMQYRVYGTDGTLERIVRVPEYDLTLTEAELQRERELFLGESPSPSKRDRIAALPTPRTRPAYSHLLVDTEGSVWAAEDRGFFGLVTAEPWEWEVFSPRGMWLGSVQLPGRFAVFEIGSDYVLGSARDSLGVEHVQLLRLDRS